jgi:hypothetical protein
MKLSGPQSHSGRYGEETCLALPIAEEAIPTELRNGELHGLHFSRRRVRLAGRVVRIGGNKSAHVFLLAAKKRHKIGTCNT